MIPLSIKGFIGLAPLFLLALLKALEARAPKTQKPIAFSLPYNAFESLSLVTY
jgi:hypothetical protein